MKRINKPIVRMLILVMSFLAGCERDDFDWGIKVGNITYSGNVIFLGPSELSLITAITPENITFDTETDQLEKIVEKSILVMGVSEKTPYGALRKVTGITTNKTELIVTTENANLEEAIKEGTINVNMRLLEKNFRIKSISDGVFVNSEQKSFDGLAVTLDKLEIFTEAGLNVILNGSVGISPEIGITIKIASNKINELKFATTLSKIDELTIASNAPFSESGEKEAAQFIHSPILTDSLVFVPEIVIKCGFNGTVSSSVLAGVRQDRTLTSSMNYYGSGWNNEQLEHTETFDFIEPVVSESSNLEVYSGPEMELLLFGVPLQVISAFGIYSLKAERSGGTMSWNLSIGNDGNNSVKSEILGLISGSTEDISLPLSEIGKAPDKY